MGRLLDHQFGDVPNANQAVAARGGKAAGVGGEGDGVDLRGVSELGDLLAGVGVPDFGCAVRAARRQEAFVRGNRGLTDMRRMSIQCKGLPQGFSVPKGYRFVGVIAAKDQAGSAGRKGEPPDIAVDAHLAPRLGVGARVERDHVFAGFCGQRASAGRKCDCAARGDAAHRRRDLLARITIPERDTARDCGGNFPVRAKVEQRTSRLGASNGVEALVGAGVPDDDFGARGEGCESVAAG